MIRGRPGAGERRANQRPLPEFRFRIIVFPKLFPRDSAHRQKSKNVFGVSLVTRSPPILPIYRIQLIYTLSEKWFRENPMECLPWFFVLPKYYFVLCRFSTGQTTDSTVLIDFFYDLDKCW